MEPPQPENGLPPIPSKRYFTIGEVGVLCAVKPHVLRYWEQEFSQLKPVKRRGNRRYYQPHEVQLIRQIRNLLYDQGFTINGARLALASPTHKRSSLVVPESDREPSAHTLSQPQTTLPSFPTDKYTQHGATGRHLKQELLSIIDLLVP